MFISIFVFVVSFKLLGSSLSIMQNVFLYHRKIPPKDNPEVDRNEAAAGQSRDCFLVAQQRGQKGQTRKFCCLAPTFFFIYCFLVPFPFLRNACLYDTQLDLCLVITLLFKWQDRMEHVGERKTFKLKQEPECSSSELLSEKSQKATPSLALLCYVHSHGKICSVFHGIL